MFGFPIILAAFAMMGAPASTPVSCIPTLAPGVSGATWFDGATGAVQRIELSPQVCRGVIYMAASPHERAALRFLNQGEDFLTDEGLAAVVVLHESHHATGDRDETATECAAMANVAAFIAAHVAPHDRAVVLIAAQVYDRTLPAAYHEWACNA